MDMIGKTMPGETPREELHMTGKLRDGTEIIAFEFRTDTHRNKYMNCPPVRGVLSATKAGPMKAPCGMTGCPVAPMGPPPSYFIPYDRNGSPACNKAVLIRSRRYATDMKSATTAYNALVRAHSTEFRRMADEIDGNLLPEEQTERT